MAKKRKLALRAAAFIRKCPLEDYKQLSVSWTAQQLNVNRSHLSRAFKAHFGYTINEFITEVKIERAEKLLENTHLRVKDIAELLDYGTVSYFDRMFSQENGYPPNFRRLFLKALGHIPPYYAKKKRKRGKNNS